MSNDLFQKVVDTVQVSGGEGGILSPEQSARFIDYMWDATSLGQTVRKRRMTSPVVEIDKMDLGRRIARHATEGIDDARNAGPTFSKIQLTTEKIRLDWELTSESLEDNIEQGGLEDHIARLMATQLGNDLEDLAINGDVDWDDTDPDYALMSTFDGYRKRALTGGATVLDAGGAGIDTAMFNRAYKALPRKYKARRGELRIFIGSGLVQDYHQKLVEMGLDAGTTVQAVAPGAPGQAPSGPGGFTGLAAFGIPLYEVPLFNEEFGVDEDEGYFVLTHPDNHIWGVKRDITVHRQFAPKKDAIEYTVFTRQGVQIDNLEAYVVVENIANEDYNAAG